MTEAEVDILDRVSLGLYVYVKQISDGQWLSKLYDKNICLYVRVITHRTIF